jgi:hypothetical protein
MMKKTETPKGKLKQVFIIVVMLHCFKSGHGVPNLSLSFCL